MTSSEEELEEMLIRFENFRCQETFYDADIHTVYLRAFDYYVTTHEKVRHDQGGFLCQFCGWLFKG